MARTKQSAKAAQAGKRPRAAGLKPVEGAVKAKSKAKAAEPAKRRHKPGIRRRMLLLKLQRMNKRILPTSRIESLMRETLAEEKCEVGRLSDGVAHTARGLVETVTLQIIRAAMEIMVDEHVLSNQGITLLPRHLQAVLRGFASRHRLLAPPGTPLSPAV